jgi:hypothetical protein
LKTPLFVPMLAPAATPLALRLNMSVFVEPSVVAALAVNESGVPTVMFVDEKGNVSEGVFEGVTVLVSTVTMKLVAPGW